MTEHEKAVTALEIEDALTFADTDREKSWVGGGWIEKNGQRIAKVLAAAYRASQARVRELELYAKVSTAENDAGDLYVTSLEKKLEMAVEALRDLHEASTEAYKNGRIPAEPFVHAGNVLTELKGGEEEANG